MAQKFIINDGNLILGHVEYHKELLKEHNNNTIGGGYWHLDKENHTLYLYGTSQDFGSVTEKDALGAWYHHDFNRVFSTSDKLIDALNKHNPIKVGLDFGDNINDRSKVVVFSGASSAGSKALRYAKLAHFIDTSSLHIAAGVPFEDKEHRYLPDPKEFHESFKIEAPPAFELFPEKKKKKPCTSHQYVKKGEEKEEYAYGSFIKEVWKCKHCDHPLH